MKYLHEKMLDVQSNGNSLEFSENEQIEQAVDNQDHLSTYYFFHPCILCFVFFLIFLMVAK